MFVYLKGIIGICSFAILTLLTIGGSFICSIITFLSLFLVSPVYVNSISTFFKAVWFNCVLSYASIFIPSKFIITSNRTNLDGNGVNILISNHQIEADWFYVWYAKFIFCNLSDISIVMKDSLYKVPIFGMVNVNIHLFVIDHESS